LAGVPNFQELMSLVGHFLLRWGWLEEELRGGAVPDELASLRLIRNALCHRMIAASADPESDPGAYVSCRLLDGTVVRYSAAELEEAIRDLEKPRHRYRAH